MGQWSFSVPVGSIEEMELSLAHCEHLDLAGFCFYKSLGLEMRNPPDKLIESLRPYSRYFNSMHMFNSYTTSGIDGRPLIAYDMQIMAELSIPIGVVHMNVPRTELDVDREVSFLLEHKIPSVTIAIENLPDSGCRRGGYDWIVRPSWIANYLYRHNITDIALCLDTSHALCRNELEWDNIEVSSSVGIIHLSDSRVGFDDHGALHAGTSPLLLQRIAQLASISTRDGVIVLEQATHVASLTSLSYIRHFWGCSLE